MEKGMQQLIDELGDAINSALSQSERFAAIMMEMEESGYNAYVVLEASIGFRKNGESEFQSGEAEFRVSPQPQPASLKSTELSDGDLDFLRELKISAA